jgi:hypothetical protein
MRYKIPFLFDYVFPNGYIPNASIPETTLINYINSFNSKYPAGSTFLEASPETFNKIFDGNIGGTTNSLSQFFYNASCYDNFIEAYEDSIFYGSQKSRKFIYPMKPNPNLLTFFGDGIYGGKPKQNGNYFWKYIPEITMDKIVNGQGVILIDYTMEPNISKEQYDVIHKTLSYINIPKENIIIVINSLNAKELYETWFSENERKLTILNLPFCLDHSSWFYTTEIKNNTGRCMDIHKFLDSKSHKRSNYFLMKSKQPRHHRMFMLYNLEKNNVLGYGNWSYLGNHIGIPEHYGISDIDENILSEIRKKIPHNLKEESVNSNTRIDGWSDKDYSTYINSYFEICLETLGEGEYLSFTEKVFKPLINFQPFFLVSSCGSLSKLRELGFKTFSPFIDESYDNETNTFKRTEMIANEVKRLCNMSQEEIHTWYWNMQDILVHNHNHLLNVHKMPLGTSAIKFLYDITN